MSSGGLYPEKFALYFSTMNSLSAKIYSDIQAVEETISTKSLSYNEKCAVVDKCLIHDIVQKPKHSNDEVIHDYTEETEVHFNDPCLDQSQTTSLLLAVYPRKPEKYVFEDNGFWLDEHSHPFSYAKQSQATYCPLEGLVQNLPAVDRQSLLVEGKDEKAALRKSQREIRKMKKRSSEEDFVEQSVAIEKKEEKTKKKTKAKAPSFFGVNVMGISNGGSHQEQIRRDPEPEVVEETTDEVDDEDSKLPKQKQNLELIAELQAKLNKNKTTTRAPIVIQPSASASVAAPAPHASVKLSKPKAPPPPPPKTMPGKAVKVTEPVSTTTGPKRLPSVDAELKSKFAEKETQSQLKAKPKEQPISGQNKDEKEEFLVDVSSPCRIATPKTGFDFLDNW